MNQKYFTGGWLIIGILEWLIFPVAHLQWPVSLPALWMLGWLITKPETEINLAPVIGVLLFFDFWQGGTWGVASTAVIIIWGLVLILKKIILLPERNYGLALVWLIGGYLFFSFLSFSLEKFLGHANLHWKFYGWQTMVSSTTLIFFLALKQNVQRISYSQF